MVKETTHCSCGCSHADEHQQEHSHHKHHEETSCCCGHEEKYTEISCGCEQ